MTKEQKEALDQLVGWASSSVVMLRLDAEDYRVMRKPNKAEPVERQAFALEQAVEKVRSTFTTSLLD